MPKPTADPEADPSLDGGQDGGDGAAPTDPGQESDPAKLQEATLAEINRMTGRSFTSLEEAQKHLQELNSFVGNPRLREDAESFDKFAKKLASEQGITAEEARRRIKETMKDATPAPANDPQRPAPANASEERLERLERFEFLSQMPDAKPYIGQISKYAKANGVTLEEAYTELYGEVFKRAAEDKRSEAERLEKMATSVNVNESAPPAPPPGSKESAMKKKYAETGDERYLAEALKLQSERLRKRSD